MIDEDQTTGPCVPAAGAKRRSALVGLLRRVAKRLLSRAFPEIVDLPARLNSIEYAFEALAKSPHYEDDGLSLNGQVQRRRVVENIFEQVKFDCIAETGTFLGNTTGWFAKFGVDVYSSEIYAPAYFVAKQRLAELKNVHLEYRDSRAFLQHLVDVGATSKRTFFYLDAHWFNDLPLLEEVMTIHEKWGEYLILIDDFQVPGDAGYGYDVYGPEKTLDIDYLNAYASRHGVLAYSPTIPSVQETGGKRGYVFLTKPGPIADCLAAMQDSVRSIRWN